MRSVGCILLVIVLSNLESWIIGPYLDSKIAINNKLEDILQTYCLIKNIYQVLNTNQKDMYGINAKNS